MRLGYETHERCSPASERRGNTSKVDMLYHIYRWTNPFQHSGLVTLKTPEPQAIARVTRLETSGVSVLSKAVRAKSFQTKKLPNTKVAKDKSRHSSTSCQPRKSNVLNKPTTRLHMHGCSAGSRGLARGASQRASARSRLPSTRRPRPWWEAACSPHTNSWRRSLPSWSKEIIIDV